MDQAPSPGGPLAMKSSGPDTEKNKDPESVESQNGNNTTDLKNVTDKSSTSSESDGHDFASDTTPTPLLLEIKDVKDLRKNNARGYCQVNVRQVFESRYEAIKVLGSGSFGVVWMVTDKIDGGYKALKFANAGDKTAPKTEISNFKRLQKKEGHGQNNFVKFYDTFEHQSGLGKHIVMSLEFVGPNLRTIRSGFHGFLVEHVIKITKQILHALNFLHQKCKMIHGDLKPGNIMLQLGPDDIQKVASKRSRKVQFYDIDFQDPNADFNVKIGDLGLSKKISPLCHGHIQTCQFRAPEVFLKNQCGPPADMWSLGCTVFELATGDYLFPCKTDFFPKKHLKYHLSEMSKTLGRIPKFVFTSNKTTTAYLNDNNSTSERSDDDKPLTETLKSKEHLTEYAAEVLADLLHSMLDYDVKTRCTAEQALNHELLNS